MKRAPRFGWLWLGLVVLTTLVLSACGGGGGGGSTPATPAPVLSVSPLTLSFTGVAGGANPASQTVTVSNTGNASLTSWSVSSNQTWLTATPTTGGPLAASSSQNVTVSATLGSLVAGTYNGTLTFTASGLPNKTVAVTLTVSAAPVAPHITLSLNSVGFTTADQTNRTISLTNQNTSLNVNQTLNWQATNLDMGTAAGATTWFAVSPSTSQSLGAGLSSNITVSLVSAGYTALAPGSYSGSFQVVSTSAPHADNTPVTVTVTLVKAAPAVPQLSTSPASLSFTATTGGNPSPDTQSVTITNAGTANLNWSATLTATSGINTWGSFTTSSSNAALTPGNSNTLTVKVVSSALAAGTYNGTVNITSDGGNASVPITLTVSAPAAAASTTSIGGRVSVTQLSSLVASPRARRAAVAQGSDSSLLTNADVLVTVLHNGGKRDYRTQTDSNGNYTVDADVVSGDTVTVTISKAGYVPYIQTIEVTDQNKNSVFNVTGVVAPTNTVVVPAGTALKASGEATPGFRFGLVRNRSDGALKAFRSSSELQGIHAAAGGRVDPNAPFIDVNIPANRVGSGVSTLTAEMAGFNPADNEDRSMFPGEFKGIGGGSAAIAKADTTEYALESIAFMQLDVKQDDGKDVQLVTAAAGSARAAAADPVTIVKWIPQEGCGQMQKYKDRDTLKAGVQVPIYTYNPNTGKWGYLGEGTIKVWNGASYDIVPEGDIVDTNNGGKLSNLACGIKDYYFEIVVDTDWYTWWNLDYPILTDISNQKTIHGKVTYDDGSVAAGVYVYAYAAGGSYYYAYTDVDGNYSFDMFVDTAEFNTYTLDNFKAYNYKTWREQSPTALPTAGNNYTADFVFTNPYTCKAQGRVLRDTTPVANEYIYAWGNSSGYWDYVQTGADGRFSLSTPCSEAITLWSSYQERTFTVNNSIGPAEQSDNGRVSVLKDMVLVNQPPQVYLSAWPTDVTAGNQVELYGWAWDQEDYSNVTYSWSMSPAAKSLTGRDYVLLDTTGMSGEYVITLTGTDTANKAGTASVTINVTPPAANKPPILMDFNYYLDTWSSGDVCSPSVVFWTSAFDPEGGTLTYQWGAPSGSFTDLGWGEFRWTGATTAAQQVSLVVSDPQGAQSKTLSKVVTPQTLPTPQVWWVDVWPNPQSVNETVELSAYGWVENGADMTYAWTLTDPNNAPVTLTGNGPNLSYVPTVAGTYNGTVRATACGRQSVATSFSFTVNALAGNTPPEIWYAAGYPSGPTQVALYAYGWDQDWTDTLTYTWSDGGAGGTFDNFGGDGSYVVWTAPASFNASVTFSVTVSDGTDSATDALDPMLVDTVNGPGLEVYDIWTQDYPVYGGGNGTFLYVNAMDPSGIGITTYTWTDTTEPGSITVGADPSAPAWNPTILGDHTITVTVSNGTQTSQPKTVTIYVEGAPSGTDIIIQ